MTFQIGHYAFMAFPQTFMNSLLGMWTQSDRTLRRTALLELFRPDARFHDADGEFVGYEALEGFSDSLQSRFPGARFTLTAATAVGNAIRASWAFGPPERPDAVTGMDFVILDGDKIRRLYAFVERPGEYCPSDRPAG
jgi:SnoaL-like domain